MNKFNDLHEANSRIPRKFKKAFVKSLEKNTPEYLRLALNTLDQEKPELFEPYKPLSGDEAICEDRSVWPLSGYFYNQARLCKKNFSRERIEHVITVKSYLVEQGFAGFTNNLKHQANSESSTTVNAFKNVDVSDYPPSAALKKHVKSEDLSNPKKGGQLTTQNVTNVNYIYIEHNPFTVETLFQINGETPPESLEIQGYRHKRLQLWVEKIFDNLSEIFNGANSFFVKFKGVESDFIDLQEAAEKAKQLGMSIELEWQAVKPAEERLDEIKLLLETLQKDPKFTQYIESSGAEAKRNFEAAFDNNFDAYVVATMSSGKSTFINAMLGQDLLPAANEATTATIAHIIDNKTTGDRFTGKRLGENRMLLAESDAVHPKLLKEWNSNSETKAIELTGNIRAVEPNDNVRLVLTDTPGPNNSQDEEHERTTMGFIQDSKRNPLILYILNGTQLCTNDDRRLLKLVAEEMSRSGRQSKDRFLFVINKMDDFDPEKGEDIGAVLGSVRKYLQDNGIDEPNIFPISARFAYLLREQGELTRSERRDKRSFEDLFLEEASMDLPMYTTMPSKVRNDMETKTSSVAMLRSGLPAVEATIDEYIKKYAFPLRLHRAHEALSEAIKEGIREAELTQKMELDQQQLDQLHRDIKELKKRRDSGFNTKAYQEKVKQEGHALPEGVQHELDEIEAAVYTLIRTLGEDFDGEASVDSAHQQLDTAARDVEFAFKKTINNYEQAFDRSQELIKDRLREEYQQHVASLFPDSKALELPAFKMLKESIGAISLVLDLQEDEVQSREEVSGYRTVSVSEWYNPFSWWKTEQVAEYKTVEFVKLKNIWNDRLTYIRTNFNDLRDLALARINADKDKLVENYLSFMEREFMAKFDALLDDLETKIKHSDQLEAAIEEAKKEQLRIKKIKQDVANILQF
ncbi:dynamin family protein [Endozoicomonas sp. 4G]|uniref:dynamin family protein n=1 Tax=Endozoicomonas sp. 4G TaxID=2872754 RepID=UPI002078DC1C|nr:dynamin family protein [Endozoicomonas sp. 4G]